jgi:hypothetical protein
MPSGKVTAQSVETAEKMRKILALRVRGVSYRRIAEELGIDIHSVHKWSIKAINGLVPKELRDEARAIEGERLDELWLKTYMRLEHIPGNESFLKFVDMLIKLMQRRTRLYGLDEEKKVHLSGSLDVTKHESPLASKLLADRDLSRDFHALLQRAGAGVPHAGGPGANGAGNGVDLASALGVPHLPSNGCGSGADETPDRDDAAGPREVDGDFEDLPIVDAGEVSEDTTPSG